jgi:hypothetical protein
MNITRWMSKLMDGPGLRVPFRSITAKPIIDSPNIGVPLPIYQSKSASLPGNLDKKLTSQTLTQNVQPEYPNCAKAPETHAIHSLMLAFYDNHSDTMSEHSHW